MSLPGTPTLSTPKPRSTPLPPKALSSDRASVWAVGGGKGGIGKTFLASNSATVIARLGLRVVLIDVDFGGANLHTTLGVRAMQRVNLTDFLQERVGDLEEAAIETPVPGLRLILGALGEVSAAQTTAAQRVQLMEAIRKLKADVVILDLAAGMNRSTIDFFVQADEHLLVTTPEPTAIENAYGFLRAALHRRLSIAMTESPIRDLLREALAKRGEKSLQTPLDLVREIRLIDPNEGPRFERAIAEFQPRLILNQVRTSDEVKLGFSMASMARRYFGVHIDYIGYINYDDFVWRSIKDRKALVLAYPQSDGALYVRQIVKKMLQP